MIDLDFTFESEVWLWHTDKGAWHFATLPVEMSEDIKAFTAHLARGFRSVKVDARIGATTWSTSIFPSKERGAFILPLKVAVRKAEQFAVGDTVEIHLTIATE